MSEYNKTGLKNAMNDLIQVLSYELENNRFVVNQEYISLKNNLNSLKEVFTKTDIQEVNVDLAMELIGAIWRIEQNLSILTIFSMYVPVNKQSIDTNKMDTLIDSLIQRIQRIIIFFQENEKEIVTEPQIWSRIDYGSSTSFYEQLQKNYISKFNRKHLITFTFVTGILITAFGIFFILLSIFPGTQQNIEISMAEINFLLILIALGLYFSGLILKIRNKSDQLPIFFYELSGSLAVVLLQLSAISLAMDSQANIEIYNFLQIFTIIPGIIFSIHLIIGIIFTLSFIISISNYLIKKSILNAIILSFLSQIALIYISYGNIKPQGLIVYIVLILFYITLFVLSILNKDSILAVLSLISLNTTSITPFNANNEFLAIQILLMLSPLIIFLSIDYFSTKNIIKLTNLNDWIMVFSSLSLVSIFYYFNSSRASPITINGDIIASTHLLLVLMTIIMLLQIIILNKIKKELFIGNILALATICLIWGLGARYLAIDTETIFNLIPVMLVITYFAMIFSTKKETYSMKRNYYTMASIIITQLFLLITIAIGPFDDLLLTGVILILPIINFRNVLNFKMLNSTILSLEIVMWCSPYVTIIITVFFKRLIVSSIYNQSINLLIATSGSLLLMGFLKLKNKTKNNSERAFNNRGYLIFHYSTLSTLLLLAIVNSAGSIVYFQTALLLMIFTSIYLFTIKKQGMIDNPLLNFELYYPIIGFLIASGLITFTIISFSLFIIFSMNVIQILRKSDSPFTSLQKQGLFDIHWLIINFCFLLIIISNPEWQIFSMILIFIPVLLWIDLNSKKYIEDLPLSVEMPFISIIILFIATIYDERTNLLVSPLGELLPILLMILTIIIIISRSEFNILEIKAFSEELSLKFNYKWLTLIFGILYVILSYQQKLLSAEFSAVVIIGLLFVFSLFLLKIGAPNVIELILISLSSYYFLYSVYNQIINVELITNFKLYYIPVTFSIITVLMVVWSIEQIKKPVARNHQYFYPYLLQFLNIALFFLMDKNIDIILIYQIITALLLTTIFFVLSLKIKKEFKISSSRIYYFQQLLINFPFYLTGLFVIFCRVDDQIKAYFEPITTEILLITIVVFTILVVNNLLSKHKESKDTQSFENNILEIEEKLPLDAKEWLKVMNFSILLLLIGLLIDTYLILNIEEFSLLLIIGTCLITSLSMIIRKINLSLTISILISSTMVFILAHFFTLQPPIYTSTFFIMGLIILYISSSNTITDLQKKHLHITIFILVICGILKLLLETLLMVLNNSIDLVVTFNLIIVGIIISSLAARSIKE